MKTALARGPQSGLTSACLAVGLLFLFLGRVTALEWEAHSGFRRAALTVPANGAAGFTSMSADQTGLTFTNWLSEEHSLTNHVLLNGSGVAAGDVDGDGWCDLYFCGLDGPNKLFRNRGGWQFEDITEAAGVACPGQYSTGAVLADLDGDGDLDLLVSSVGQGVRAFLNDGQGHFKEVTAAAGLASGCASLTMALADMDGDGTLDLYVANYRTWTARDSFSMRIKVNTVQGQKVVTQVNGRPVTEPDLIGRFTIDAQGILVENGEADVLYRNDGRGHFQAVSFIDGSFLDEDGKALAAPPYDWGLSAMFRDLNGDNTPDLYVCNDLDSPDRIWINLGQGRFQAIRRLALRKTSHFSMGVDVADLNRDGFDEIFVADMLSLEHLKRHTQGNDHRMVSQPIGQFETRPAYARNTLFLNQGDGDYAEIAYYSGVAASDWSWSPVFLDVDLDGYEDLLITTGFERDVQDLDIARELESARRQQQLSDAEALRRRRAFPRLAPPNHAFRNRGDLTFEEVGPAWGFALKGVSQGMALADLDNDGDLDVVINNLNAPASLLRNNSSAPRVAVRLRGQAPNTHGIGAKIRVIQATSAVLSNTSPADRQKQQKVGTLPDQSQEMICGGRYLSGDEAMRSFAAGHSTNQFLLEITWRTGKRSVISNAAANFIYEVAEAGAVAPRTPNANGAAQPALPSRSASPPSGAPQPLFQDVSHLIVHLHHEEPFDDFQRQPLLPKRLSQLGPGLAWCDLDGDGNEDLVIGSGKGGPLAAWRNNGAGGFSPVLEAPFQASVTRDQTTILPWRTPSNTLSLIVGNANYEDGLTNSASVRSYDLHTQVVSDLCPDHEDSPGPLALTDLDGNGSWALFVGGRVIPGSYPKPASSWLYRFTAGRWQVDAENSRTLAHSGLVSGAVFSDLDQDGLPELVLACEWGPLKIFRNVHGRLVPWDAPVRTRDPALSTLQQLSGFWMGVTTGDLDGDGRLDIIASNWGRNTRYESHPQQPVRLYYGDLDGNGVMQTLEAYYDAPTQKIVPWQALDRVADACLWVRQRFHTFRDFGSADINQILGERKPTAKEVLANWLDSTVFLNRGDCFEVHPMPAQAQWSPAFAVCVADVDGNGTEDVFLSQNFFATEPRTGRADAGRGLWLRGDGRGGLAPIAAAESGLRIYGEQRGAALCDYDADGRVDLAVTQNGSATKLYKNVGARPGLRVRLRGPPTNPLGIGAVLRLAFDGRLGPAREVHAGSGYWSQDSSVPVLSVPDWPAQLWVRWAGGKTNLLQIPAGSREIAVDAAGTCQRLR
ncbi:MAG TPA: VCBS repeat-containing protein [Verrucomicrobiae bacterium]|nr:VCBS repeat-containing protein [Verrucomicrobiae bacterium]